MTREEYFAHELDTEYRNEFYAGELVELLGDDQYHATMNVNLIGVVANQLRRSSCTPFGLGMRIRGGVDYYFYADFTITCGKPQFEKFECTDTLLNPTAVFEIWSDASELRDRGVKWRVYQQMPSVQHYVLISQYEPLVEIYTRLDNGDWLVHTETGLTGAFTLAAVDVTLKLSDLYETVPLEPVDQEPE